MKTREYKIKTTHGETYVMGRVAGPFGVHKDITQKPAPYFLTHIPSGYALLNFYQARPAWAVQDRLKDAAYPDDPVKEPKKMREVVAKVVRAVEDELGKEITPTRFNGIEIGYSERLEERLVRRGMKREEAVDHINEFRAMMNQMAKDNASLGELEHVFTVHFSMEPGDLLDFFVTT